jgi:hypothetical protein
MTIQDTVPITTLERAISNDVITSLDLVNREISETIRALVRNFLVDIASNTPTISVRTHVASGLNVEQTSGYTITVNPGILCQQVDPSPPDVPAPDTFDSSYRFGLLMTAEDVGDPWDATTAFWLLQGRVERETTLQEFRDIWNPVTELFAPSGAPLDKRYESQVEFSWKKGTATDIPLPDTGWAPIGWVARSATYVAITTAVLGSMSIQIEDLSPETSESGRALRKNFRMQSKYGLGRPDNVAGFFDLHLEAEVGGLKCYAKTRTGGAGMQITHTSYIEAASAAALGNEWVWGYVYLAPLPDAMPKKVWNGGSNVDHNGVLVVSRTLPDENGQNLVALTPPAPMTNYVIPIGGAAHVGFIRAGVGGITNTKPLIVSADGKGTMNFREFNSGNFQLNQGNGFLGPAGSPYLLDLLGPFGTEDQPHGVGLECVLRHVTLPGAPPVAAALETTFGMGAGATSDDTTVPTAWPWMMLSCTALQHAKFWLHPQPNDMTMSITFVPRTLALGNSGGGAADGVGVIEEAGVIGFQF